MQVVVRQFLNEKEGPTMSLLNDFLKKHVTDKLENIQIGRLQPAFAFANSPLVSAKCGFSSDCAGGGGECGFSSDCAGGGGECGFSSDCAGEGCDGEGKCGFSSDCAGGGGMCSFSSDCAGGGGECGFSYDCAGS